MGENTGIEWARHTLNLWWGCVHHSPACDHCYAEAWARHRLPPGWTIVGEGRTEPRLTRQGDSQRPQIWGADAPRVFPPHDSAVLREPLRWNRKAEAAGERHRVFVSSMCDIFERHRRFDVNAMMDRSRQRFFTEIVPSCEALDFLLLTKRPHDVLRLVPPEWREAWPANVWVGTTVEDQQRAIQRLTHLVAVPAPVRFISAEPLLGPLDLGAWIEELDWVIVGGESGHASRRSEIEWIRSVRDQAVSHARALFFKQWGNWAPTDDGTELVRLRRKDSRRLDGRTWDQVPAPKTRSVQVEDSTHVSPALPLSARDG